MSQPFAWTVAALAIVVGWCGLQQRRVAQLETQLDLLRFHHHYTNWKQDEAYCPFEAGAYIAESYIEHHYFVDKVVWKSILDDRCPSFATFAGGKDPTTMSNPYRPTSKSQCSTLGWTFVCLARLATSNQTTNGAEAVLKFLPMLKYDSLPAFQIVNEIAKLCFKFGNDHNLLERRPGCTLPRGLESHLFEVAHAIKASDGLAFEPPESDAHKALRLQIVWQLISKCDED